jgi:hypothetical protein
MDAGYIEALNRHTVHWPESIVTALLLITAVLSWKWR